MPRSWLVSTSISGVNVLFPTVMFDCANDLRRGRRRPGTAVVEAVARTPRQPGPAMTQWSRGRRSGQDAAPLQLYPAA